MCENAHYLLNGSGEMTWISQSNQQPKHQMTFGFDMYFGSLSFRESIVLQII